MAVALDPGGTRVEMIVRLTGEIDCATGPAVAANLIRTMSENHADVVADVGGVSFLDCAGLGSLVAVGRWAAERGWRFRLTRPAPAVRRLLDAIEPGVIELLPAGGATPVSRAGSGDEDVTDIEGFCPGRASGRLSGVEDAGRRLEIANEELRVADEEVRTQQELIEGLLRGRTAERLAAVRLAAALPVALVGTDRAGVVREANRAASALLHVEQDRLRGKPIAVLVQPSDRRALRSALARAAVTGYPEHLQVSVTPRRDGTVPVDMVLVGQDRDDAADGSDDARLIRLVIAPRDPAGLGSDTALLAALGSVASLSSLDGDLHTALTRIAALAAQGIGPALAASIVIGSPAAPAVLVSTDRAAQVTDGEQHRTGSGPSWDAYANRRPVGAATLHGDQRWPALHRRVGSAADGVAAVPLIQAGEPAGVLTVYGMAALADEAQIGRAALFADAAAALLHEHQAIEELRRQEAQLREALSSRAIIDQAKGIIMARHGTDADAAFAELVRRSQHANVKLREVARQLVAEVSSGPPVRALTSGRLPSTGS
jgi:anti-anti-sigma factor